MQAIIQKYRTLLIQKRAELFVHDAKREKLAQEESDLEVLVCNFEVELQLQQKAEEELRAAQAAALAAAPAAAPSQSHMLPELQATIDAVKIKDAPEPAPGGPPVAT